MEKNKLLEYDKKIKDGAGDTTPIKNGEAFYAVAYGSKPGIKNYWLYEDMLSITLMDYI